MVNPFDLKTTLLAKHAQHVVLIHFPIALFITAVAFDLIAQWTKRRGLAHATYLQPAGGSDFDSSGCRYRTGRMAVPTRGTEAEGHSIAAPRSGMCFDDDDLAGVVGTFPRTTTDSFLPSYRLALEVLAVAIVALTGHLGGFLSGVSGPG